jgi:hypothetical protein
MVIVWHGQFLGSIPPIVDLQDAGCYGRAYRGFDDQAWD